MTPLGDATYGLVGEVTGVLEDAWLVDFGLHAYCDTPPPERPEPGALVAGKAYLGVDYYLYFECLHDLPGVSPLIYSWRIDRIRRRPAGTEIGNRWKDVDSTGAWKDERGMAEYVLHCTKLDEEPKRRSATAIYP